MRHRLPFVCCGLVSLFLAACSAGKSSLTAEKAALKPVIDFSRTIEQKNSEFRAAPITKTKAALYERRSRIQDEALQEFSRCPECFLKKIVGAQRTYLFDAITDCEITIRVGTPFDGGKWICAPQTLPARPIVYSFGIGDNVSFDMDMAGIFGCDVFMFDPSPSVAGSFRNFKSGQACGRGRLYFQPVGLGPVSNRAPDAWKLVIEGKSCEVRSLAEIARSLGHKRVDILKIDIEGGEFAALKSMLSSGTLASLQVRQVLVEFHLLDDEAFADFMRIVGGLKKQGFLLFRKEFNPYAADKCAEYAFVKKKESGIRIKQPHAGISIPR